MLNYLYAILESEARLAISELGLDPGIGFLHSDTRTRDSLACDLMEVGRAHVDLFLLKKLSLAPLQRKWFFEERDGNCRLISTFAAELAETSRLWRHAVGPLAEWIAHTLWSTTLRPSQTKAPATRLTQSRKRAAKGIPTTAVLAVLPRNQLALEPVSLNPTDPIARARRTDTQRRQTAALRNWKPENPQWLDEKFYREQLQPQLRFHQTSTIKAALSVSEPYALSIRTGKRIPHPRHWSKLMSLVGNVPNLRE
jgi:hypothetical protein